MQPLKDGKNQEQRIREKLSGRSLPLWLFRNCHSNKSPLELIREKTWCVSVHSEYRPSHTAPCREELMFFSWKQRTRSHGAVALSLLKALLSALPALRLSSVHHVWSEWKQLQSTSDQARFRKIWRLQSWPGVRSFAPGTENKSV